MLIANGAALFNFSTPAPEKYTDFDGRFGTVPFLVAVITLNITSRLLFPAQGGSRSILITKYINKCTAYGFNRVFDPLRKPFYPKSVNIHDAYLLHLAFFPQKHEHFFLLWKQTGLLLADGVPRRRSCPL